MRPVKVPGQVDVIDARFGGIYNRLYLLGVSSQWIDVVVAAVLLAAAAIDVLSRRGTPRQA
jgi:ABC-type xylose transport system permease subunit